MVIRTETLTVATLAANADGVSVLGRGTDPSCDLDSETHGRLSHAVFLGEEGHPFVLTGHCLFQS